MLNYYRCFLPSAAQILKPLTDVLHCNVGCIKWLTWSPEMTASFASSKRHLVKTVPLAHPDPVAHIMVATDASDTHIGGVLQQVGNGAHRLLGFISRKLSSTEMRYAALDHKLLATHNIIKHFQPLLEARAFQLWTDHKPLVAALSSHTTPTPVHRQHQMAFISEHTSDVIHKPGKENVVADLLSSPCKEASTQHQSSPIPPPDHQIQVQYTRQQSPPHQTTLIFPQWPCNKFCVKIRRLYTVPACCASSPDQQQTFSSSVTSLQADLDSSSNHANGYF